jgi:hypothetical protein
MYVTKLHRLYDEQGQSPWLDNLTRVPTCATARSPGWSTRACAE